MCRSYFFQIKFKLSGCKYNAICTHYSFFTHNKKSLSLLLLLPWFVRPKSNLHILRSSFSYYEEKILFFRSNKVKLPWFVRLRSNLHILRSSFSYCLQKLGFYASFYLHFCLHTYIKFLIYLKFSINYLNNYYMFICE